MSNPSVDLCCEHDETYCAPKEATSITLKLENEAWTHELRVMSFIKNLWSMYPEYEAPLHSKSWKLEAWRVMALLRRKGSSQSIDHSNSEFSWFDPNRLKKAFRWPRHAALITSVLVVLSETSFFWKKAKFSTIPRRREKFTLERLSLHCNIVLRFTLQTNL